MRAAISRSERSTSARLASSPRERVERLDEPGVGHRRGRVVGEGPDQPDLGPG